MTITSRHYFVALAVACAFLSLLPIVARAGGGDGGGDGGASSSLGFAANDGFYGNNTQGTVGTSDAEAGGGYGGGYASTPSAPTAAVPTVPVVVPVVPPVVVPPVVPTVVPTIPITPPPVTPMTPPTEPVPGRFTDVNDDGIPDSYSPPSLADDTPSTPSTPANGVPDGYTVGPANSYGVSPVAGPNGEFGGYMGADGSYYGPGESIGTPAGTESVSFSGSASMGGSSDGFGGTTGGGAGYGTDSSSNPDNWWSGAVGAVGSGLSNFFSWFTGNNNNQNPPTLGGNNNGQQIACTMEAKLCPDGSYVGRTGPSCQFAPCPTASTTPNLGGGATTTPATTTEGVVCTMDARMCPDGSYVGRVAPSCNFAACPMTGTSTPSTSTPPVLGGNNNPYNQIWIEFCSRGNLTSVQRDACRQAGYAVSATTTITTRRATNTPPIFGGVFNPPQRPTPTPRATSSWPWSLLGIGVNYQGGTTTRSTSTRPTLPTAFLNLLGGSLSPINPAAATFVNLLGTASTLTGNQNVPPTNYVNFGNLAIQEFGNPNMYPQSVQSTSTLGSLLDRLLGRKNATSTATSTGTNTNPILGLPTLGGGTKPNNTNTITFEVKVTNGDGQIMTNWSASTTQLTLTQGAQLQFRWNASDYTQCLPFFNDNGRYALMSRNRAMLSGNTEIERYNVPELSGSYRIECGGQKNDESGVDEKVIRVTAPASAVPNLLGTFGNQPATQATTTTSSNTNTSGGLLGGMSTTSSGTNTSNNNSFGGLLGGSSTTTQSGTTQTNTNSNTIGGQTP